MAVGALYGAGHLIQGVGQYQNATAQEAQERQNAAFYREQAEFAKKSGERQRLIFDRESQILYGEQLSGFAKAGIDTSSSAEFMAREILYRDQESQAIRAEADLNVKLARMRANAAEVSANDIASAKNINLVGGLITGGALGMS